MPRLIDLTQTLDPDNRAKLPPPLAGAAPVVAPLIEYLHPATKGADDFCRYLGCTHDELPGGEGWGAEMLSDMSSHCGTHVDAPLHSASQIEGAPARTITDIDLEELYRPGLVLDVRPWAKLGEPITIEMLDAAMHATGQKIKQGDAVLIRTGQERYGMTDPEFYQQPGMTREATLHLTSQGATILGTDALGWDLPFGIMARKYQETKDQTVLWDGHKAIVQREAFIVQQMTNLGALPLSGFMVGFFPIKLAHCSAAPARVVAFVD
ncbi:MULTISPECIES: cyclase family protein [unclassified Pseudomonas]|uniref:cyclase family protein n=1 Tax=unclassified Pseudomonas TaxID=196821 RepID=UPI00230598B9|nr:MULTISPECIES: cyclase family protein [unclassified Pseudomonas]MDU9414315.1 cyclase family protein [Pseudomonas sp. zfem005]WCD77991.1 cyclase family protein [Pseudomonas sp. TUM22785]